MQDRTWQPPEFLQLQGQFVTLRPFVALRDIDALYAASHGTPEKEAIWNYLYYGPFDSPSTMKDWMERNTLIDILPTLLRRGWGFQRSLFGFPLSTS
ncbi:MAG: hypothetical protein ACYTXA_27695 [Nostoc sp.]